MQSGSFLKQWWRLGGVFGILFVILFIVGVIVQEETPTYGDSADQIRSKWIDNGDQYLIGDYICGIAVVLFFFPFLAALRSLLGAAEGGVQMWSRIVFAGGLVFIILAGAGGAYQSTLAFGNFARDASDDTLKTLMGLDVGSTHFIFAGLAIMALATAIAVWQTGVLPVWFAGLSLVYGVLALIAPLSILTDNPDDSALLAIGFIGALIWLLVTSVMLALKKEAPVPAPVAAN